MITLRPYQKEFVNDIIKSLRINQKIMAMLPTGGGKTFCFSFIVEYLLKRDKRILILVHKEELVTQTVGSLNKFGVVSEAITSRIRKPKHFSNVYTAMERTGYNRLNKDRHFFRNIDYIIVDEAHILTFQKVFNLFPQSKVLGFTGTPVHQKRETFYKCDYCGLEYEKNTECCGSENMEWARPFAFSKLYDDIVVGTSVNELIEMENLVKEIPIVKKSVDLSNLKTDKTGEFTEKSQQNTFAHPESLKNLLNDYLTHCKGKKTMIFTPSTKINASLLPMFLDAGINAKIYDSVNSEEDRKDLVKWFDREKDAVLINTNIFTTGFDVTDVEVIMLYRATTSLSLFIQIVGRGARITDKIYKDSFLHIDYGGNIDRHNLWSDPTRDWKRIFKHGLGKEKPKKEDIELVDFCDNCGALISKSENPCPHCDHEKKPKKKKEETPEGYKLVPITKLPPPNGKRIIQYTKRNNEGTAFAFRIMMNQICDLFRFYDIDKDAYENSIITGEFDKKIDKMIRKCYFEIIQSDLTGANRTLDNITKKTKEKIDKMYF